MPVKKLGSVAKKPDTPERASRTWSPKTKFMVVGVEAGRKIFHTIPLIEGREDEAGKTVVIEADITAKDLQELGVNIDNWLDKKLIAPDNKNRKPWVPAQDEMDIPKSNVKIMNSE